jgi:hypothetical protein
VTVCVLPVPPRRDRPPGPQPGASEAGRSGVPRRRHDQVRPKFGSTATGLGGAHPERVTGIEPALSAWESTDFTRNMHRDQHFRGSASDREYPLFTALNGTLMARPETGGKGRFIADVGRIVAAARAMLQGEGRYAARCQEGSCCKTCVLRDYSRHEK